MTGNSSITAPISFSTEIHSVIPQEGSVIFMPVKRSKVTEKGEQDRMNTAKAGVFPFDGLFRGIYPHSLVFSPYAYYNTCNMQKRQIMLNTPKILCKKAC